MKRLFLIGGTMGVGKTTTSRILRDRLPSCAFLDGDWCWDMHPFKVTEETKRMVTDNICHVLNNFLACTEFENVVFCWVMHEQGIIDGLVSRLKGEFELYAVSLVCSEEKLRERIEKDVAAGIRLPDVADRSAARIPLYENLNTVRIDVSDITPGEAAAHIAALANE